MTFRTLHCALTAAACAGIIICAAAFSHAGEWKMQPFTMTPFKLVADLGLDDLSLDRKDDSAVQKPLKKKSPSNKRSKRKPAVKKSAAVPNKAGVKK